MAPVRLENTELQKGNAMAVEQIFEQDAYARSSEAEDIAKKRAEKLKAEGGEAGRAVLFRPFQQEPGVDFGCCHGESFHGALLSG